MADLDLLREHATQDPAKPGNWILRPPKGLRSGGVSRSAEATLAWIHACHYLGVCVQDTLTTEFLSNLVAKVSAIEARLAEQVAEPSGEELVRDAAGRTAGAFPVGAQVIVDGDGALDRDDR